MKLKKRITDYINTTISVIYLENLLMDYTKYLQTTFNTDLPNNTSQLVKNYIKSELKKGVD